VRPLSRLQALLANLATWLWDLIPAPCAFCGKWFPAGRLVHRETTWGAPVAVCRTCNRDVLGGDS